MPPVSVRDLVIKKAGFILLRNTNNNQERRQTDSNSDGSAKKADKDQGMEPGGNRGMDNGDRMDLRRPP